MHTADVLLGHLRGLHVFATVAALEWTFIISRKVYSGFLLHKQFNAYVVFGLLQVTTFTLVAKQTEVILYTSPRKNHVTLGGFWGG